MTADLIARLRCAHEHSQQRIVGSNIFQEAATALEAKDAEIERLRGEVYVPGSWHCAKCKFTLLQSNLNARDGTVTPRDKPGDKCPNCNSPLWRATWKQDALQKHRAYPLPYRYHAPLPIPQAMAQETRRVPEVL